jgi:hypothetical protein
MVNRRQFTQFFAGSIALPVLASAAQGQLVKKLAEDLQNGEYNWYPERSSEGPLLIIVSIPDQKVHVYRNGIRVAASSCSTGKPGHRTPTGVFKILQKDKHHKSSTYSNAPMPNMQRLTWSGIALHAGQLPGYPASHGCVRLPKGFSELLFGITRKGMTVVLADNSSQPATVVHPKLILGDYARDKFDAVHATASTSKHHDDEAHELTHTSVIVSHKDKKASLYENDQLVAESSVEIADDGVPLQEAVYHLSHLSKEKQELHWAASYHGKSGTNGAKSDLPRIKTPKPFAEEVHRRTHRGMILVTTANSHATQNRASGFVIIDSLY